MIPIMMSGDLRAMTLPKQAQALFITAIFSSFSAWATDSAPPKSSVRILTMKRNPDGKVSYQPVSNPQKAMQGLRATPDPDRYLKFYYKYGL